MVQIQIDLSHEEDSIVEMYKISHLLRTKELAIKKMISFFKAKINPETLPDDKYFKA